MPWYNTKYFINKRWHQVINRLYFNEIYCLLSYAFFVVLDHRKNDSDFVRLHYNLFRGNYDHETTNMFLVFVKVSRNSYYISSHFFRLSIVFSLHVTLMIH